MRKRDTVPEHPLRAAERKNAALRDEVRFLHEALFFTEILAAGFSGHSWPFWLRSGGCSGLQGLPVQEPVSGVQQDVPV
mgnify:CR=1 FL=1